MSQSLPRYVHRGAITRHEVRILTLRPSPDFNSEIICDLDTFPRHDRGRYTALSYWWGPQEDKRIMKIGEFSFEIGKELEAALQHLRRKDVPRRIWCDAICIIQEKSAEGRQDRKEQVYNMDETYSNASEVVVWLGCSNEKEGSSLAMEAINVLGSQLDHIFLDEVPKSTLMLPLIRGETPMVYGPAIMYLLRRPWFSRLWVIQEVCLAPLDTTLVCGHDQASFWKLTRLQTHAAITRLAVESSGYLPFDRQSIALAQERPVGFTRQYFVADRENVKEPREKHCTLLSHLWHFRNRQCMEPIDRIYALLGIASDITKSKIEPDYEISQDEAFTKATWAIISTHGKIDVLSMCQGLDEENRRPSWVPDLNLSSTHRPQNSLTVYETMKPYFKATLDSEANPQFQEYLSDLVLEGYQIDTIKDLGFQDGSDWKEALLRSRSLAEEQANVVSPKYADVFEAFWRTLITNRTGRKNEARPDVEGAQFSFWWSNILTDPKTRTEETERKYLEYQSAWLQFYPFRNFFVTVNGYMGLAVAATRLGDHICLLSGGQVPLVLRKVGESYRLVGECYVHGIMDGQLWDELSCTTDKSEFRIL